MGNEGKGLFYELGMDQNTISEDEMKEAIDQMSQTIYRPQGWPELTKVDKSKIERVEYPDDDFGWLPDESYDDWFENGGRGGGEFFSLNIGDTHPNKPIAVSVNKETGEQLLVRLRLV